MMVENIANNIDITVIGDCNLETKVYVYDLPFKFSEVIYLNNRIYDRISGSAFNVVETLLDNGMETGLITTVGHDSVKKLILKKLSKNVKIENMNIYETQSRCIRSVVLIGPDGNKQILHDGKDSLEVDIRFSDKVNKLIDRSRICHFTPVNWTRKLIEPACTAGKIVTTDIHTDFDIHGYHKDYVEKADITFFSICGLEEENKFKDIMINIAHLSSSIVVATAGEDGSYVYINNNKTHKPLLEKLITKIPPEKYHKVLNFKSHEIGKVRDTTGAGDAFAAGFLKGVLTGLDFEKVIDLSNHVAVKRIGQL